MYTFSFLKQSSIQNWFLDFFGGKCGYIAGDYWVADANSTGPGNMLHTKIQSAW